MYSLLLSDNNRNNRDQVYTPTSKMTKTIRNNMKQWFQTLNNRQLRTVIPDRGETKRDVLRLSPTYYLERDYRPHPRKGESRQKSVVILGCRAGFVSSRNLR